VTSVQIDVDRSELIDHEQDEQPWGTSRG
jgi:hypothetical protein